jgi:penicillin-binding protein-related factor A (putative recombinase)
MARQSNKVINDGKSSEETFEETMRLAGNAVFRLRDKRDLHGLNGRSVAAFGQPSDYVVVSSMGAFLAEVKSTSEKTSFPLSCFTKAQLAAMSQCVACRVGDYYHIYIHNLNDNKWYCTDADGIIMTLKSGKKSIPWNQLYAGKF